MIAHTLPPSSNTSPHNNKQIEQQTTIIPGVFFCNALGVIDLGMVSGMFLGMFRDVQGYLGMFRGVRDV